MEDNEQATAFTKKSHPQLATEAWVKYVLMATLGSAIIATLVIVLS